MADNEVAITFGLTKADMNKIAEWRKGQNLKLYGKESNPYGGAIGGSLTYSFTPTSLGVITKVKLSYVEEELDLTNYDEW